MRVCSVLFHVWVVAWRATPSALANHHLACYVPPPTLPHYNVLRK